MRVINFTGKDVEINGVVHERTIGLYAITSDDVYLATLDSLMKQEEGMDGFLGHKALCIEAMPFINNADYVGMMRFMDSKGLERCSYYMLDLAVKSSIYSRSFFGNRINELEVALSAFEWGIMESESGLVHLNEANSLRSAFFRLTRSDIEGRFRDTKSIIADRRYRESESLNRYGFRFVELGDEMHLVCTYRHWHRKTMEAYMMNLASGHFFEETDYNFVSNL